MEFNSRENKLLPFGWAKNIKNSSIMNLYFAFKGNLITA